MKIINNHSKKKGSTTVLIIMFVLLMVCIAILSISQTHSSYKLSKKMALHISDYYKLETSVTNYTVQLLAEISNIDAKIDQTNIQEIFEKISRNFDNLNVSYKVESEAKDLKLAYDIWDKTGEHGFRVMLLLNDNSEEATILNWQALTKEFEDSKPIYEDMKNAN